MLGSEKSRSLDFGKLLNREVSPSAEDNKKLGVTDSESLGGRSCEARISDVLVP